MMVFEKSKWIWLNEAETSDSYAEFTDTFKYTSGGATVRLSVDTDYALFINGKYVASNQYGDFEHYKIYDEIDLTPYVLEGENKLRLIVYYCGENSSRYRPAVAGLIYEVISDDRVVAASGEHTPSRREPHYVSGRMLRITPQLGFSFSYDSTARDDGVFSPSRVVNKNCAFYKRPIKKQTILPPTVARSVRAISPSPLSPLSSRREPSIALHSTPRCRLR